MKRTLFSCPFFYCLILNFLLNIRQISVCPILICILSVFYRVCYLMHFIRYLKSNGLYGVKNMILTSQKSVNAGPSNGQGKA